MSLVVLLLLLARPDAGDAAIRLGPPDAGPLPNAMPALPFTWELPPKAMHEVPIDGTTYVSGVPVRLRYVMVNDTPVNVGKHFLDSFKRQGLYVEAGQDVGHMLTGVDPQSIMTYTVVLQPNGPDHTTVILGEAKVLDRKPPSAGDLPLPPTARAQKVLPVKFEGYTLVSVTVPDALADVRKFYAVELPRSGWQPKSETEWVRAGELLEVTLTVDAATGRTRIVLKVRKLQ